MINEYVGQNGLTIEYDETFIQDIPTMIDAMHTMAMDNDDKKAMDILVSVLKHLEEKYELEPEY